MKRIVLLLSSTLVGPILAAPLVQNGGFETGDLSNWTYDGSFQISGVASHAGAYSAQFGSVGSSTLQQSLSVAAGGSYELSLSVAHFGAGANSFAVSFDGQTIDSVIDAGAFGFTTVRIANLSAASASANLAFVISGGTWAIDNVKLTRMDQLLVNGGFEAGDFSGWQRSATYSTTATRNFVVEGKHAARLGTKGAPDGPRGSLAQTVDTEAGRDYDVSFWLRSRGSGSKELTATFGGETIFDYARDSEDVAYTMHSATFEGTGSSTELRLSEKNQGFWYIDDVRVSLIAQPDIRLAAAILNAPNLTPVSDPVAATPEPQPLFLVGGGLVLLGIIQRRRRKTPV